MQEHNEITAALDQLRAKVLQIRSKPVDSIGTFCPWLDQFHWDGGDDYIELLGQYNGNSMPNMNRRLKIIKFEKKAFVCATLRKPIRIGVLCSNGKMYNFLIKCGEDLRQDERIQQLQNLMSDLMKNDKNCNQQKLTLRTYKVTPMNVHCGAISWIDNTDSIENLLANSIENWERKRREIINQFQKVISKYEDSRYSAHANVTFATKCSRSEVTFKLFSII